MAAWSGRRSGDMRTHGVVNNPSAAVTSKEIDPMRRTSLTSGLLILILATSAFGCTAGWGYSATTFCPRPGARQSCAVAKRGTTVARGAVCGHTAKSLHGGCSLRSLAQLQFVEIHRFEIPGLLPQTGSRLLPSLKTRSVSSVGSPETDRGPPRS
jgi:hypothetical protein